MVVNVDTSLHIQAGGLLTSPWARVNANKIQVDSAGRMEASGLAPGRGLIDPGTGVDTPSAGKFLIWTK